MNQIEEFWNEFKKSKNLKNLQYDDAFHFELNERAASSLLNLVLAGKKCATSSSVMEYEKAKEPLPSRNQYLIITDFFDKPYCVVKVYDVIIKPFNEFTYDIVCLEGEDQNLTSWRKNHHAYFQAICKELNEEYSDDMLVVFEKFKLVYTRRDYQNPKYLLLENIDKIHTTTLGNERICKNLSLHPYDCVEYCKKLVLDKESLIYRNGKNWYVESFNEVFTINANNYCIITAHKIIRND